MEEKKLLNEYELSKKICCNRKTLYEWRLQGMPFIEVSRLRIAYDEVEVIAWMKAHLKGIYSGNRKSDLVKTDERL